MIYQGSNQEADEIYRIGAEALRARGGDDHLPGLPHRAIHHAVRDRVARRAAPDSRREPDR